MENGEAQCPKANWSSLFKHLFLERFDVHDALGDVIALRWIFYSYKLALSDEWLVNKSSLMSVEDGVEDTNYLDSRYRWLVLSWQTLQYWWWQSNNEEYGWENCWKWAWIWWLEKFIPSFWQEMTFFCIDEMAVVYFLISSWSDIHHENYICHSAAFYWCLLGFLKWIAQRYVLYYHAQSN